MQSSENSITLLPALPEEWKDGSVKGICARGGFIVDMEWKDSKVTSLYIQSRKGGKTKVCFNGESKNITSKQTKESNYYKPASHKKESRTGIISTAFFYLKFSVCQH